MALALAAQLDNREEEHHAFGCIDFYGYSPTVSGIILGGWIGFDWDSPIEPAEVHIGSGENAIVTTGIICLYPREDVKKFGFGFILAVEIEPPTIEFEISEITLVSDGRPFRVVAAESLERLESPQLVSHARSFVSAAHRSEARTRLLKLLERPYFNGTDTLERAAWPIHIEIDKAYLCPPASLALSGWFADPFRKVARLRIRCGSQMRVFRPDRWIAIRRSDVVAVLGPKCGLDDERCGFLAFVPDIFSSGETLYFEIETKSGDVFYKKCTPPQSTGFPVMKEILGSFDLRGEELSHGYDNVAGPAVEALNSHRLSQPTHVRQIDFGTPPAAPRCSTIIPLYGRIDFIEYQLAFFAHTLAADHELLYVLDDPARVRETESLAAASFARFERPFTLLCLSRNVGYGPANNIGLRHSHGEFICFLNSDVFPRNPDWLESMLAKISADPTIGVVGGALFYEDGTVQHEGCSFQKLPEFDNWIFSMHPNKGLHPRKNRAVTKAKAVTGACMVLGRALADELGGFDEGYAIGDFEDIDLCLRAGEKGFSCAVDLDAELYHLERRSQGNQTQTWRMNLTLYNAWRFQKLWAQRFP